MKSGQMWPRFLRYSSFNCLILFSRGEGAISALSKVNPTLVSTGLRFISRSTSTRFLSSSISLNRPATSRSFIRSSPSLASHSCPLEVIYSSRVANLIRSACSSSISLPRDSSAFRCRMMLSSRYCCTRRRSCSNYIRFSLSWDSSSLNFRRLSSYYSTKPLSFLAYLSYNSLSLFCSLAYKSSNFRLSRSSSAKPRCLSSLNSFSLSSSLLKSCCTWFSFSAAKSDIVLFWLTLDCMLLSYYMPLLRSPSSAFPKAFIPSSTLRLTTSSSLSSSARSPRALSCISQNSFNFYTSMFFSSNFLRNSSPCISFSFYTYFRWVSCSSFIIFSENWRCNCSCSSSIFFSYEVSATTLICLGSVYAQTYRLISLVCSRGLGAGEGEGGGGVRLMEMFG